MGFRIDQISACGILGPEEMGILTNTLFNHRLSEIISKEHSIALITCKH